MSYYDGLWHHQDQTYSALYDALQAVWPARRCGDG